MANRRTTAYFIRNLYRALPAVLRELCLFRCKNPQTVDILPGNTFQGCGSHSLLAQYRRTSIVSSSTKISATTRLTLPITFTSVSHSLPKKYPTSEIKV